MAFEIRIKRFSNKMEHLIYFLFHDLNPLSHWSFDPLPFQGFNEIISSLNTFVLIVLIRLNALASHHQNTDRNIIIHLVAVPLT